MSQQPFIDYFVGPLFRALAWVLSPIYPLIFAPLDRRIARKHRRKLIGEAKAEAPFLFSGDCRIDAPEPIERMGFDYASFVVERGNLLYKLSRCRGDVDLKIAFLDHPNEWHDLGTVLFVLTGEPRHVVYGSVQGALTALRDNFDRIEAVGDPKQRGDLLSQLEGIRRDDQILVRQYEWELNSRLRYPK